MALNLPEVQASNPEMVKALQKAMISMIIVIGIPFHINAAGNHQPHGQPVVRLKVQGCSASCLGSDYRLPARKLRVPQKNLDARLHILLILLVAKRNEIQRTNWPSLALLCPKGFCLRWNEELRKSAAIARDSATGGLRPM